MESLLNYYYDIIPDKIVKNNNYYIIKCDNGIFLFAELHDSMDNIKKIIDILNKTTIKYHLLVLTKFSDLYVNYEDNSYCLLKVRCNLNHKPLINDFKGTKTFGMTNWGDIWAKRIDYYESQVEEVIKEPNVRYALQYYIGLTEIAIYYFNLLKKTYSNDLLTYTITHKIISSPINLLDFYNPLNLQIDIEARDIAEYFKAAFFNETQTESELLQLIDLLNINDAMANYFFLRLLYPSYFFYLYDDYIVNKNKNNKIVSYIKKSRDYEILLSKVYSRLTYRNNIKIRLWFIKSQR